MFLFQHQSINFQVITLPVTIYMQRRVGLSPKTKDQHENREDLDKYKKSDLGQYIYIYIHLF